MDVEKRHKCTACRRLYASKRALADHRRDSHVKVERRVPAPSKGARRKTAQSRAGKPRKTVATAAVRTIAGSDVIAVATVASTTADPGDVIVLARITPSSFNGTRLEQEAKLFARWRPLKLVLEIIPSAGAMTSGTYIVGCTTDLSVVLNGGNSAIHRVSAMTPNRTNQIYKSATLALPTETLQRWYRTDASEESDHVHCQVFVILASPISTLSSAIQVNFIMKLHWAVQFEGPTLPGSAIHQAVYVDPGYEGYHTTSDSSVLQGTCLTLKAHAGGAACPFSKAAPDTIYQLDESANLTYYDAESKKAKVKYATLAKNAAYKVFLVFATLVSVQKYIETGASVHCLPYHSAGDTVVPDNPAWTPTSPAVESKVQELEERIKTLELELASKDS